MKRWRRSWQELMSLRRADQLVAEAVKLEILTLVVMTHIKRHKSLKLYRTN